MKLVSTPSPVERFALPMSVPPPKPPSAQKTLVLLTATPQRPSMADIFTYSFSTVEPFSGARSM